MRGEEGERETFCAKEKRRKEKNEKTRNGSMGERMDEEARGVSQAVCKARSHLVIVVWTLEKTCCSHLFIPSFFLPVERRRRI